MGENGLSLKSKYRNKLRVILDVFETIQQSGSKGILISTLCIQTRTSYYCMMEHLKPLLEQKLIMEKRERIREFGLDGQFDEPPKFARRQKGEGRLRRYYITDLGTTKIQSMLDAWKMLEGLAI